MDEVNPAELDAVRARLARMSPSLKDMLHQLLVYAFVQRQEHPPYAETVRLLLNPQEDYIAPEHSPADGGAERAAPERDPFDGNVSS